MIEPIELHEMGSFGIISDLKPHLTPPEAFSDAMNIRFSPEGAERFTGHQQIFGTLEVVPEFVFNVPGKTNSFWIYASLDKAYVYEGGVHSNITRQTESADVDYTVVTGKDWQGTIIGGIPILNNAADVPQYWTGLATTSKLADLEDWPSTLRAKIIRAFGPYLIAFNLVDNSVNLPKTYQWSHFTDPGSIPSSWDYTDATVDAGRAELTDDKGGEILDAIQLGNQLVIYTTDSAHTLRFVGGTAIFAADLLLKDSGILASKCACAFNKGTMHFVATVDDIIIHAGTKQVESVVTDKVRKKIFREIDPISYTNSYTFENSLEKEVWFCYPTSGNTYPNVAFVWNYQYKTCSFRDAPFVSVDSGPITDAPDEQWDDDNETWDADSLSWSTESRKIVVAVSKSQEKAFKLDTGLPFGSATPVCYMERTGISLDGLDRFKKPKASLTTRKVMLRMWPKISGEAIVRIRAGSQQHLEGPITWGTYKDFNPLTQNWIDLCDDNFTPEGLLLAYRIESLNDEFWRLEGISFEILQTGRL